MSGNITDWSTTAGNNDSADGDIVWTEGQNAKTVNNSARQMMGRVAEFLEDLCGTQTVGGTANAITVTLDSSFTALANKRIFALRAASDNTDAVTINVNSIGSKAIRKFNTDGETALVAGDLQAGGIYLLVYSTAANSGAGAWIVLNPTPVVYQTQSDLLDAISALSTTDGNFIVGNGTTWVAESGSTARSSLGLGTAATTDVTAYATAAQGAKADGAMQPLSGTTDNAVVRFDGTSGAQQTSGVTIDDSDNLAVPGALAVTGAITADGNKVAEIYGGTTQDLTDYPIGTQIFVDSVTANRNSVHDIYLGSSDATTFALSGTTKLLGTWNARGSGKFGSGGNATLFVRTQ